ncbi:MAG: hypothetical protein A2Z34_08000 [Planctomycetes bacterium RBG_16_59_8]|nr:MAG: hypothetical protein A2Z34_08000 [Planctomycetes bacterium RBG_16_59_8]
MALDPKPQVEGRGETDFRSVWGKLKLLFSMRRRKLKIAIRTHFPALVDATREKFGDRVLDQPVLAVEGAVLLAVAEMAADSPRPVM